MLHVPKLISKSLQTKLLQATESWVGPGARNDPNTAFAACGTVFMLPSVCVCL